MSMNRLAVVIFVLGDRLVDRLGPSARRAPVRSGWVATTPIVKRPLTKMLLATFPVLAYASSRYHAEAVGAACADVISFCEILDRETTEAGSVRLALPRMDMLLENGSSKPRITPSIPGGCHRGSALSRPTLRSGPRWTSDLKLRNGGSS